MVKLKVNGIDRTFDGDPNMPLLWYGAGRLGVDGDKVWLWHGSLRRLHGS